MGRCEHYRETLTMPLNERHPPVPPVLVLIFGIFAVSSASLLVRFAQRDASSIVVAAARLGLATLVLAPFAVTRRREELGALKGQALLWGLLSGFFLALHFTTWITSLEYTTVASSVVLVTTTPLWVGILAPYFLKEPLSRATLLGLALALVGGVIVGISDTCSWQGGALACPPLGDFFQGRAFLGDLLALSGAFMAAAYVMIGRRLRRGMSLLGYIFVVYGMAAVVLVVIALLSGQSFWGYPPLTYLWLVLLALVPQLLGHSSFNYALGYVSAAYVSITLIGEPIGSIILAYLILQEAPTGLKIIGAILILIGIFTASRQETRPQQQTLNA